MKNHSGIIVGLVLLAFVSSLIFIIPASFGGDSWNLGTIYPFIVIALVILALGYVLSKKEK